jgi:hypothetical protein
MVISDFTKEYYEFRALLPAAMNFIGAVMHVLVDDPTRGYGGIENMLGRDVCKSLAGLTVQVQVKVSLLLVYRM